MEKQQTKKEIQQLINKAVYEHVNQHYPNFDIDDSEGYGRIYIRSRNVSNWKNTIEYHQSRHEFSIDNEASYIIKTMVKELERVVDEAKLRFS
jgi:hypothetical protein